MEGRRLYSLGLEINDVMTSASICVLLILFLVHSLYSSSSSHAPAPVTAATLVYLKSPVKVLLPEASRRPPQLRRFLSCRYGCGGEPSAQEKSTASVAAFIPCFGERGWWDLDIRVFSPIAIRLEKLNLLDPSLYSSLGEILQKEQDEGTSRKQESRSRAILWLTRSMDFGLALLETVDKDSESSLEQMVDESYKSTLKPWHGWISSAAYKVALKLLPEKEVFISLLMGNGHDCEMLKGDIQTLVPLLRPFLDEIHALLKTYGLDRIKSC